MNPKERARSLKKTVPAVFLALKDKDTPVIAKVLAGITVGYALSPIDLIPDFIPVLGYLDDVILLPALIALTIKLIPATVWERNLALAENMWQDGKPKKWYYAIPIVLIWLLILYKIVGWLVGLLIKTHQKAELSRRNMLICFSSPDQSLSNHG